MKPHELEDQFLRFRDTGDVRALAKVFDVAAPQLLPVAVHLARRRDEAEDLIQATFLTAIERAETWERGRAIVPWLLGILALHARKLRQKEGRALDLERVRQPSESDPEGDAASSELRQAVDSACGKLPEGYASVVRRHLVDGAEAGELAGELGISNGAARVRLHRGLKLLRRSLPLAYAPGATLAVVPAGLTSVRAAVLERASLLTGSPVPASGFAPLPYLFALLLPLGLALPLWFAFRAWIAAPEPEPALAATSAPVEPAPAPGSAAPIAEVIEPREPEPREPQSPPPGLAVVRGRALLPDGTPAAGATVKLDGRKTNEERVREFGLPANWSDPAALTTGPEGTFQFTIDPPRAYCFDLDVDHAACAMAAWNWYEILPGATVDLGDVALERAGTVVVRILDAQAQPLCSGWSVDGDAPAPGVQDARRAWSKSAKCTAGSGEIVLERVPARRVKVEANTDSGGKLESTVVEVPAGGTEHVDLTYTGPDLARRIAVAVSIKTFRRFGAEPFHVTATRPGSPPLVGVPVSQYASFYAIDGCEPGSYDVEISGPAFTTWTQHGVQPGETLRAKLEGNAGLRLRLTNPDGTPYAGPYTLRGKFALSNLPQLPTHEFVLVDASQGVPEGGLVTGVIPADYDLALEVAGHPEQKFSVLGLAPHEVREIARGVADVGLAITGRVVGVDGSTPLAGTEVQLTRGAVAGHSRGSGTSISALHGTVPRFEKRIVTNAEGRFEFPSLDAGTWTVRAKWGYYLGVESTVELSPQTAPLSLRQPEHGSLSGRLIVPSGAPLEDTDLRLSSAALIPYAVPTRSGRDPGELNADWTFQFGPLPAGSVELSFSVTTGSPQMSYSAGMGVIHVAQILPGEETVAEIDLRDRFPGRLRVRVSLDGQAATGGFVQWSIPGEELKYGGRSVDLDGTAPLGSIRPGTVVITYEAKDKTWAWRVPQPVAIAPAQDVDLPLAIATTARDLRCTDVANGSLLADVEIEWRTALGGEELVSKARTDAAGLLHLKMPEQQVRLRCVGDPGEPVEISWGPGTGPLTVALRRAP